MPEKFDFKIWWAELLGRVRLAYPYFLGFYLLSLFVAIFSATWRGFFYWPAFHASIFFFTILFVLTFKFDLKFTFRPRLSLGAVRLVKDSSLQMAEIIGAYLIFLKHQLTRLSRRDRAKIAAIIAISVFALLKDIGVVDFFVLAYALVSFLFVLDSRYAAGSALVLLAFCPVFIVFKQSDLAEIAAIYAYYFLVITVLTQIRELMREKKAANQSLQK